MLGYATGVKGYWLWCRKEGRNLKFIISSDLTFEESAMSNQRWESISLAGKEDDGARQMVEFVTQNPYIFVINDEH